MDEAREKKGLKESFFEFYHRRYKQLLIIPIILFMLSFGILGYKFATTGDLIARDVSLKGGVTVTVTAQQEFNVADIQQSLEKEFPGTDVLVRSLSTTGISTGFVIDSSDITGEQLIAAVKRLHADIHEEDISVAQTGSALGESFFREAILTVAIAFVLMSLVVMFYFRNLLPGLFVVLSAFADIIMPFALMSALGIKLSTAGVAAFLLLIGYSVDTDILLTTRCLKQGGMAVTERIRSAMHTGVLMTLTSFSAVTVAFFFVQSDTIKQIMFVLMLGLFFDLINTWITNASILRMYLEKRENAKSA
ncbi:protein translocase subunit SecF [Candidatus Woesearchaeota archaeon]|nr:protein translocase subunit SecF [Candidatus Woesearchaeota archaeon]